MLFFYICNMNEQFKDFFFLEILIFLCNLTFSKYKNGYLLRKIYTVVSSFFVSI